MSKITSFGQGSFVCGLGNDSLRFYEDHTDPESFDSLKSGRHDLNYGGDNTRVITGAISLQNGALMTIRKDRSMTLWEEKHK